jgi:hypothetical protein
MILFKSRKISLTSKWAPVRERYMKLIKKARVEKARVITDPSA